MTECYTEEALAEFNKAKAELEAYKTENFDKQTQIWIKKRDKNGFLIACNKEEVEKHQQHVRELMQQMENIAQDSLVNSISSSTSDELKDKFKVIAPLVYRRRSIDIVKKILGFNFLNDGDVFTFSEPVKIKTTYLYCGCGHIMKLASEMTEAEALLAEEHLKVCQYPLEEVKEEQSQVSKHKIGHWDCRACYKEPSTTTEKGSAGDFLLSKPKETTAWCPKFLRPFRLYTPLQYLQQVKGSKSCYAGILHKQISVTLEKDGKQYLVVEEMCDTCGYGRSDKKEIKVPEQMTNQTLAK